MGFDHVRLGVEHAYGATSPTAQQVGDVRHVIEAFTRRKFAVIVSLRLSPEEEKEIKLQDPAFIRELTQFWSSLAQDLRSTSKKLVFPEVLNEPYSTAPGDEQEAISDWVQRQQPNLAEAIHQKMPAHTIVGTAPRGSTVYGLFWLDTSPLSRIDLNKNVIYSFHYYNPMRFAQDGKGRYPFPATENLHGKRESIRACDEKPNKLQCQNAAATAPFWDEKVIASEIDAAREWRDQNGATLLCDEFGAKRDVKGQMNAGQITWLRDVRSQLDKDGIGWTYWDYKNCPQECGHDGFGLIDKNGSGEKDLRQILNALGRKFPRH
jgi:endoglucanase